MFEYCWFLKGGLNERNNVILDVCFDFLDSIVLEKNNYYIIS